MDKQTRRFRGDYSLDADTPFYGLFLRIAGQTRRDYKKAKERMSVALGGTPSNPMILDELLRVYLSEVRQ